MVVTIIVLLLLAGISITMLTGQNGILTQADKAKAEITKAGAEEKVHLEVLGSYGTEGKIEFDKLNDNLKNNISGLTYNGSEISEDDSNRINQLPATVVVDGYEVVINEDGTTEIAIWKETSDGKITNGTIELKIGDYVNYSPKDGVEGAETKSYTSKSTENGYGDQVFNLNSYIETWQILGVQSGKILLVSSKTIKTNTDDYFYLKGQTGYTNGVEELNKISAMYGQGRGAIGARSINSDDVNKITGYDPTKTGTGEKAWSGEIYEYGNDVTYERETSNRIKYSGINGKSGTVNLDKFSYYDEKSKSWKLLAENESTTLKNTAYLYYVSTLTDSQSEGTGGLSEETAEYQLLIENTSKEYYWLASRCVYTNVLAGFALRCVGEGEIGGSNLYDSYNRDYSPVAGIRAVVYLKSDIQLEYDSTRNVWDIK